MTNEEKEEFICQLEDECISVPCWKAPDEDGAPILEMPNIPAPLHQLAPRTVMGKGLWDRARKRCYFEAGYKCQACGKELGRGECDAHELYDINYITGESKLSRLVCLCHPCHRQGIHSGRALTMFKKGNPLMSKKMVLEGAENLFRLMHEYNLKHKKNPLRAYYTFIDYAKWPPIQDEMIALIKKYDIKFYREDTRRMAEWCKWSLLFGGKRYMTPYASKQEWEEAMAKNDKFNQNQALKEKSEIDLQIEQILGLT